MMKLLIAIQQKQNLPRISSKEEYDALKSGRGMHLHDRDIDLARPVAAFAYSYYGKEW